jgi:hypothetical protein
VEVVILVVAVTSPDYCLRSLLLDLLRVIGRIFPEKYSSDLLTLPNLLELSTTGLSPWYVICSASRIPKIILMKI